MTYKGDPITEKLDKAALAFGKASGLTRLQHRINSGRKFRFRVIPVIMLALAVAGLWAQIARPGFPGFVVLMSIWIVSGAIQSFSPMGNLRGVPLDEYETTLVRSGHAAGNFAAMILAVIGCLAFGLGATAGLAHLGSMWMPASNADWFALAFFLLAVENNVATLAASAKLPKELDEEED